MRARRHYQIVLTGIAADTTRRTDLDRSYDARSGGYERYDNRSFNNRQMSTARPMPRRRR